MQRLKKPFSARVGYLLVFLLLLTAEVCIALFVHDAVIRPYVGDIIVVGTVYAFVRFLFPVGLPWLPHAVTLFAMLVEVGQAFDLAARLGLGQHPFFRILLGSVFDWADLFCYLLGGILILPAERLCRRFCSGRQT